MQRAVAALPLRLAYPRVVPAGRADVRAVGAAAATLSVFCLGASRVLWRGEPALDGVPGRAQEVFRYLLLHRERPVRRERITATLWPTLGEAAARNNFNVSLYALRRALARLEPAAAFVCHDAGAYALNPALETWIDRDLYLAHLAHAQARLESRDLAGARAAFDAADALREADLFAEAPYCEWLEPFRREVRDAMLEAGDGLTARLYDLGDLDGCVQVARRIVTIDPCNEHMQRRLMRCFARLDQHHLALRQFYACRDALARELDTIPGLETVALFDRLRRRQPV